MIINFGLEIKKLFLMIKSVTEKKTFTTAIPLESVTNQKLEGKQLNYQIKGMSEKGELK